MFVWELGVPSLACTSASRHRHVTTILATKRRHSTFCKDGNKMDVLINYLTQLLMQTLYFVTFNYLHSDFFVQTYFLFQQMYRG